MTRNAPKISPNRTTKALSLRLIDSVEAFQSLQKEWDTLYNKCERVSIFSSWDWMFTWWEVFKDQFDRELFILALYNDNELVGLAPFQICTPPSLSKSFIQGKTLYFIGNGEAHEDAIISEFQDFIVLPEFELEMVQKVSDYLIKNTHKWSFADFEFLLKDSLIHQCFKKNSSESQRVSSYNMQYGIRFTIPKKENFDQYLDMLPRRRKKMYLKNIKKLERDGEVNKVTTSSEESISSSLDVLADMVCERWGDSTGKCIFDSRRFMEFHEKILAKLIPQDRANITTMYLGDEVLSSNYMFMDKGQVHGYQIGFKRKYSNKYSPVFVMICREIQKTINDNQLFDFMFSDEVNSYKEEHFACEHELMYRLRWSPQKHRLPLFHFAKKTQNSVMSFKETLNNKLNKKQ